MLFNSLSQVIVMFTDDDHLFPFAHVSNFEIRTAPFNRHQLDSTLDCVGNATILRTEVVTSVQLEVYQLPRTISHEDSWRSI